MIYYERVPSRVIEASRALRKRTVRVMLSRVVENIKNMTTELNRQDGFFRLQFNLSNVLTCLATLVPLCVMWMGQVGSSAILSHNMDTLNIQMESQIKSNAAAQQSIIEHTMMLKDIAAKLDSVDKVATTAMIDDDRLSRVQADIKEIRARVENWNPKGP